MHPEGYTDTRGPCGRLRNDRQLAKACNAVQGEASHSVCTYRSRASQLAAQDTSYARPRNPDDLALTGGIYQVDHCPLLARRCESVQHTDGAVGTVFEERLPGFSNRRSAHVQGTIPQGNQKPDVRFSRDPPRYYICSLNTLTIPRESGGGALGGSKAGVLLPLGHTRHRTDVRGRAARSARLH